MLTFLSDIKYIFSSGIDRNLILAVELIKWKYVLWKSSNIVIFDKYL
jgi:hypothetical protein